MAQHPRSDAVASRRKGERDGSAANGTSGMLQSGEWVQQDTTPSESECIGSGEFDSRAISGIYGRQSYMRLPAIDPAKHAGDAL